MSVPVWKKCLDVLRDEVCDEEFNTWLLPLQAEIDKDTLFLFAPNRFVLDKVKEKFLSKINELAKQFSLASNVVLKIGVAHANSESNIKTKVQKSYDSRINQNFTFDNFVEGKSNQLAKASVLQVAKKLGKAYNPLLIYGGVGLGKTHLMHAVGNLVLKKNMNTKLIYMHSEGFVADMVRSLQRNSIEKFKKFYRNLDVLLMDDIQFFAGKERSQEEFFHTFNALFDAEQQIVLTCDKYPKEIKGLEDRLKSRFGWGLTVAIEPPDLETRVAILTNKAILSKVKIPKSVAFFIGEHVQSNVRELEGALKRIIAHSHFTGSPITLDLAKEALKDLLAVYARSVTVENIQKVVSEYYAIKSNDLLAKTRHRSVTRPRQIAMSLAKKLTKCSLPEIGKSFGGRDHTTVLHACRKINKLLDSDMNLSEDYKNLMRILSS